MKLVALAFGAVSTVAVAASGELIEDGAPVADAWLVATRSECRGLAHCTTSCVEVKVARTDTAGRYALASGARSISDYRLLLYRPGGRLGEYRDHRGSAQRYPEMDASSSRIAHLALTAGHMSCSGAPQDERAALLPVYRTMFAEASALAVEPEQQQRARRICRLMYWASLPTNRAPLSPEAEAQAQARYLQTIEPACNEEAPER